MKLNYIVVLDTTPTQNDFQAKFFPRGYYYKKDALDLVAEVVSKGGKAHVVPKSQFTANLVRQVMGK